MTAEPSTCLQHKSSSSLLRRMPVRGEYTIAPKLQIVKVESELGALAPNPKGCSLSGSFTVLPSSTPEPSTTHGPERSPLAPHQDQSKARPRQDLA